MGGGSGPGPVAFGELPAGKYPLLIEYFRADANPWDDPLEVTVVPGPGAVRVPGFGALGIRVMVRVTYRDGVVEEVWPA